MVRADRRDCGRRPGGVLRFSNCLFAHRPDRRGPGLLVPARRLLFVAGPRPEPAGRGAVAGLVIACAWATKYNGWLPLAVALSAFIAWGVCERFGRADWTARLPVVATLVIATLLGWSPVWLSLQSDGGYSAVTANHAQYFFGLSSWWDDFKRQLANQRFYEGWLTAAGMMLAWLLPVIIQRSSKARPTQDTDIAPERNLAQTT